MSKTAMAWVLGIVTGTVLSFRDPIFGLLAYMFEYYNHPPLRWWGDDLPDLRWSLLIASLLFVVPASRYLANTMWPYSVRLTNFLSTIPTTTIVAAIAFGLTWQNGVRN